jgi:hypothetical protein
LSWLELNFSQLFFFPDSDFGTVKQEIVDQVLYSPYNLRVSDRVSFEIVPCSINKSGSDPASEIEHERIRESEDRHVRTSTSRSADESNRFILEDVAAH